MQFFFHNNLVSFFIIFVVLQCQRTNSKEDGVKPDLTLRPSIGSPFGLMSASCRTASKQASMLEIGIDSIKVATWADGSIRVNKSSVELQNFSAIYETASRTIVVSFRPLPSLESKNIYCRANNSSKDMSKAAIRLKWPPRIESLQLQHYIKDGEKDITSVKVDKYIRVNCSYIRPYPDNEPAVSFEGDSITRKGKRSNNMWKDRDGIVRNWIIWKVRFSRRHNGKSFDCVVGQARRSITVNVTYHPSDVVFRPPKRQIEVGSTLECHADANPAAHVFLRLTSVGNTSQRTYEVESKTGVASLFLSLNTDPGDFVATCEASNSLFKKEIKKSLNLTITKIPMPVFFDHPSEFKLYAPLTFSCGSKSPQLLEIIVHIPHLKLRFYRYKARPFVRFDDSKSLANTPGLRIEAIKQDFSLEFTIRPNMTANGTKIFCKVTSVPKDGMEGRTEVTLNFVLPPRFRRIALSREDDDERAPIAASGGSLRCEISFGQPPAPKQNVMARIGGKRITARPKFRPMDLGGRWMEVRWRLAALTAADDGSLLECLLVGGDEEKARITGSAEVLYPPQRLRFWPPSRRLFVGNRLKCSAEANPAAKVSVWRWVDNKPHRPRNGTGATLTVGNDTTDRATFICNATNDYGQAEINITRPVIKPRLSVFLNSPLRAVVGGSNITIRCGPRHNHNIPSTISLFFERDGDAQMAKLTSQSSHLLELKLTPNASGLVRCEIERDGSFGVSERSLNVYWPTVITDFFLRGSGTTREAFCEVRLNPTQYTEEEPRFKGLSSQPHLLRRVNSTRRGLRYRKAMWSFNVTRADHHRQISCFVKNSRRTLLLKVTHLLEPSISFPNACLYPGDEVRCLCSGYPSPQLYLKANFTSPWPRVSNSAIIVPKAVPSDDVELSCRAENNLTKTTFRTVCVRDGSAFWTSYMWPLIAFAFSVLFFALSLCLYFHQKCRRHPKTSQEDVQLRSTQGTETVNVSDSGLESDPNSRAEEKEPVIYLELDFPEESPRPSKKFRKRRCRDDDSVIYAEIVGELGATPLPHHPLAFTRT